MSKKRKTLRELSYSESWKFIVSSRKYIYSSIILFLLASIFGFFFPVLFVENISQIILEMANLFNGLNTVETILMILGNNFQASIMMILLGVFFGLVPLFGAIFNGYILGFISNLIIPEFGFQVLWRLVPHGIFELPAVFISMGIGMKIGIEFLQKGKNTRNNFIEALKVFILFVIPLLILAAIIEGLLIVLGS